jgi:hypothetical protein
LVVSGVFYERISRIGNPRPTLGHPSVAIAGQVLGQSSHHHTRETIREASFQLLAVFGGLTSFFLRPAGRDEDGVGIRASGRLASSRSLSIVWTFSQRFLNSASGAEVGAGVAAAVIQAVAHRATPAWVRHIDHDLQITLADVVVEIEIR